MMDGVRPPVPFAPNPLGYGPGLEQPAGPGHGLGQTGQGQDQVTNEALAKWTEAIEAAIGKMKVSFRGDLTEMAHNIRQLHAAMTAGQQAAQNASQNNAGQNPLVQGQVNDDQHRTTGEGDCNRLGSPDVLLDDHRTRVKFVGDIHRTLRSISNAPLLSSANLSDFDQWSNKLMNAIKMAKTDDS